MINIDNPKLPIERDAINWIERTIKPGMRVFEYGSGSSTVYFCRRVKEVISVECYKHVYNENRKIFDTSAFHIVSNKLLHYKLIEPTIDPKPYPYSHESYNSTVDSFAGYSFQDFVDSINGWAHESFDIVFINGRSRSSCIRTAIPKVKPGGYLILSNSDKYEYQDAIELYLKKYPHQNFGEGIGKTGIWTL